jgi:LacI family transcriptional regulator
VCIGLNRYYVYLDALVAPGRPHDPNLVLPGMVDNPHNMQAIEKLLRCRPDIDGIIASVERLAVSAYYVCRTLGRRISGDMKIVGLPNFESVSFFDPPLTGVTQPAHDNCHEATRILLLPVEKKRLSCLTKT